MRKSNPFVAIPTDPSTISSQWLTFSHMANHYRKLLNVKPRVETFAPKSNQSVVVPAPKPSKSKKAIRKRASKEDPLRYDRSVPPRRKAANVIDLEYQLLLKAVEKERPLKTKTTESKNQKPKKCSLSQDKPDEYSKNLRAGVGHFPEDALSDRETDDPLHLQMGISEKIRAYLDQIQHSGSTSTSSPRTPTTPRKRYSGEKTERKAVKPQELAVDDAYHARHSNCFIPYIPSPKGTPRNSKTKSSVTKSLTPKTKSLPNQTSRSENLIPPKKPKPLIAKSKYAPLTTATIVPKLKKNTRCKNMDELLQVGLKKVKGKSRGEETFSPASGSIGTVRGSEELDEELDLSVGSQLQSRVRDLETTKNLEDMDLLESHQISSAWLENKVEQGIVRINNAYFQVGSNFSKSSLSTLGLINNKDSSRDSAYGFSSGESRITTRESTPEKIGISSRQQRQTGSKKMSEDRAMPGKYKSSLSTVASSIDQDNSTVPALSYLPYLDQTTNIAEMGSISGGSNWLAETKYINFLTSVTNDILSKGIYTNKGLKNLFHSHTSQKNKELEMDKMTYMLDRLRMDVGIPKDDSLNNLEFGYGSVKYSKGPFFYKSEGSEPSKTQAFPIKVDELPLSKSRASDLTILELHRHDFHSGDESSRMSSCTASVLNEPPDPDDVQRDYFDERQGLRNRSEMSTRSSKSSSAASLTESEIRKALYEVGFDTETTHDIVEIVNSSSRKKHVEPNNNKVERQSYSSNAASDPNIANLKSKCSFESL